MHFRLEFLIECDEEFYEELILEDKKQKDTEAENSDMKGEGIKRGVDQEEEGRKFLKPSSSNV